MSETTRKRAKGTENGINGETNSSESENKGCTQKIALHMFKIPCGSE